jgi:hypothetical protein
MPALEVRSAGLLGTPVSHAYAVKAGPWIFLNGHEAFDFAAGVPAQVAYVLFGFSPVLSTQPVPKLVVSTCHQLPLT